MRAETLLARLAVAVPVLYFGTLLTAAATWPGYSHVTRYASELGGPEAPFPAIFNTGIVAMGAVCALASFGIHGAARRAGGRRVLTALATACLFLFGVAMVMGGLFPMPNPLHGAFGLAFAVMPSPLLLALALRGREGTGTLVGVLVVGFVLLLVTMSIMMGAGQLVTRSNVGLWQRVNALAMFPWIGVAGEMLARRADAAGRG